MTVLALVVALAAVAATASSVIGLSGVLRSVARQHARERAQLIDQICHLAGRTWTPPPAEPATVEIDERELERFVMSPGQLPDEDF